MFHLIYDGEHMLIFSKDKNFSNDKIKIIKESVSSYAYLLNNTIDRIVDGANISMNWLVSRQLNAYFTRVDENKTQMIVYFS